MSAGEYAAVALFALALVLSAKVTLEEIRLARQDRELDEREDGCTCPDDHRLTAVVHVPIVRTGDDRCITPEDLQVVSLLLVRQIQQVANRLYRDAFDVVLAQVAAEESEQGLDAALDRMSEGGAA